MYLNGPLTRTQKQRKTNGTFPGSGIDGSLRGMFRKFVESLESKVACPFDLRSLRLQC